MKTAIFLGSTSGILAGIVATAIDGRSGVGLITALAVAVGLYSIIAIIDSAANNLADKISSPRAPGTRGGTLDTL